MRAADGGWKVMEPLGKALSFVQVAVPEYVLPVALGYARRCRLRMNHVLRYSVLGGCRAEGIIRDKHRSQRLITPLYRLELIGRISRSLPTTPTISIRVSEV